MTNETINKSKEELILEIKKRVEDKIIENNNADLIIKLINNSDSLSEAIAIAQMGTTYKRTGFHFDKRLEKMDNTIKYFKKNEELSFVNDDTKLTHKLIIGDNYDALLNLLVEYKNKIDVIYIDPPYGKDSMGEFANTNYNNAITRDNLLSMLYPRLFLAKRILNDEGIIFCSIDDRNHAYVKCLFDEIFGENNYVASVPRKTGAGNAAARNNAKLRKPFDYLMIYKNQDTLLKKKIVGEKEYKYEDHLGSYKLDQFQASGSDSTRNARPNLYYPIYLSSDGKLYTEEQHDTIKIILPKKIHGEDGRWMWNKEKFDQDSNDYIYCDGEFLYRKTYYEEEKDQNVYQVEKAWLADSKYRNSVGTTQLNEILNSEKVLFNNPKPIDLMKWCINLHPKKDAIVLDFFAGSGSTGHSVLQLNKEDKGNRQFILCTNNEMTDMNPNGIAYDVTSKRLKRIMSGECYDGSKNFDWIKNNDPYGDNLDVYEIEKVANFESSENKTPFDVIDETLYGLDKFVSIKDKIEWVCNNFEHTQKNVESDDKWRERLEIK